MVRAIRELKGLGPKSAQWLAEIGVHTDADLRALGSLQAWHRLRFIRGSHVTLNALYAMEAALLDCHWRALPAETKAALKSAVATSPLRAPRKNR